MTPFKVRVYEYLATHYRKRLTYLPTHIIVANTHAPDRRTRRALNALEVDGLIQHRISTKRGAPKEWRPTPMAAAVYHALVTYYRQSHDYVPTSLIAIQLNNDEGWMRQYLRQLETAGIVIRASERSGWKPVRENRQPAHTQLFEIVEKLTKPHQKPVSTTQIATKLGISPRYTRYLLASYEQQGILTRHGQRGGWVA